MISVSVYRFLFIIVRIGLFFWHPIFRVKGLENVPYNSPFVVCCNHSGMADPFWVVLGLKLKQMPVVMAKKELFRFPPMAWILKKLGVIPVDRENVDVNAVKGGLKALRAGKQLLIFPEGTRVRKNNRPTPKRGAVTLASRTDSLILPVFLSRRRYPFCPIEMVIGEPFRVKYAGKRATDEELERTSQQLMNQIYEMGGEA